MPPEQDFVGRILDIHAASKGNTKHLAHDAEKLRRIARNPDVHPKVTKKLERLAYLKHQAARIPSSRHAGRN